MAAQDNNRRGQRRRFGNAIFAGVRAPTPAAHFTPRNGMPHFTGNREAGTYSPFTLVSFSGQPMGVESQYMTPGLFERLLEGLIYRVREAQHLRGEALISIIFSQNGIRYTTGVFTLRSFLNTTRLANVLTKISEVLSSAEEMEATGAVVGISFLR